MIRTGNRECINYKTMNEVVSKGRTMMAFSKLELIVQIFVAALAGTVTVLFSYRLFCAQAYGAAQVQQSSS